MILQTGSSRTRLKNNRSFFSAFTPLEAGRQRRPTVASGNLSLTSPVRKIFSNGTGFTLVELLIAVAVIAVGMVFILGAFSQCVSSLATAQKMVTANYLLNKKVWDLDTGVQKIVSEFGLGGQSSNSSQEFRQNGSFEHPYESFNWTLIGGSVPTFFNNETSSVQGRLIEQTLKIDWPQGKSVKDLSVIRYLRRSH